MEQHPIIADLPEILENLVLIYNGFIEERNRVETEFANKIGQLLKIYDLADRTTKELNSPMIFPARRVELSAVHQQLLQGANTAHPEATQLFNQLKLINTSISETWEQMNIALGYFPTPSNQEGH